MVKKASVPDAWDDEDWEAQADRAATEDLKKPAVAPPVLSKAERIAEHTAANRKLWESAQSNETFHYLEATNTAPPSATFKPQVKVLSRKPVIAKRDPATGLSNLSLEDDSDEDGKKNAQPTIEEIRAKQKKEREEKQRRYDEARAKIFGESAPSSRGSSPGTGTTTPPRSDNRGQGRGRGGRGGTSQASRNNSNDSRQAQFESRRQPPQPGPGPPRGLYDPNYATKPESPDPRRREDGTASPRAATRDEGAPVRAPRGPDGSGRGGFGFARRGA